MKTMHCLNAFLIALLFIGIAATTATNSAPTTSLEKTKPCFQCKGTGKMKCPVPTCKNGQVDCPGPCLKLSQGPWIHMEVQGHGPNEVWRKFTSANGAWHAWNQGHVGEVIEMHNGEAVDVGKCKICGGTGHVNCSICKGAGEIACIICDGKKVVPVSWTAFDNPKMTDRPMRFKLRDGQELVGRVRMSLGGMTKIRTETGDLEVATTNIVSQQKQPTLK